MAGLVLCFQLVFATGALEFIQCTITFIQKQTNFLWGVNDTTLGEFNISLIKFQHEVMEPEVWMLLGDLQWCLDELANPSWTAQKYDHAHAPTRFYIILSKILTWHTIFIGGNWYS